MGNYQKLKEVIQAANPEIMHWGFGCEVEDASGVWVLIQDTGRKRIWRAFNGTGIHYLDLDYCTILGRPIRLTDVLLAIEKRKGTDLFFGQGTRNGEEYVEPKDLKPNDTYRFAYAVVPIILRDWNLKDDNLDHQSDETKQFLIDLLTNPLRE